MSRRKGTRERPKAEKQQYRDRYASRSRARTRTPVATSEPISSRRRWGAALSATALLVIAYGGVVAAIFEEDRGNSSGASTAITIAAALVPVIFTVVAIVSRVTRPVTVIAISTPLAIGIFLGVGAVLRDPSAALVFGFGLAGSLVLRAEPGVHRFSLRLGMVTASAILTLIVSYISPAGAVVMAPLLTFPSLVVADRIAERQSSLPAPIA